MMMEWNTLLGYAPLLWTGAKTTLLILALTVPLGFMIALPVALLRDGASAAGRAFAIAFVFLFRGAPLLALLFLVYYGAPQIPGLRQSWLWPFLREPFPVAIFVLAMNSAGFQAEVIAGALRNVPRGEVEAARSAGLSEARILLLVKAPHALLLGLRAYANEIVFVLKGTAVVSFVTVQDLVAAANKIYFETLDPFTPLLAAGALYLAIVLVVMLTTRLLERLLDPRRRAPTPPAPSAVHAAGSS